MLDAPLKSPNAIARSVAEIVRPPRRITPTQAAAGKLRNDRDVWDPAVTPYVIEPLDRMADRNYQGIVFVGPARTGKTYGIALGGMFYGITVAPADILAIYMSQDTARDFSRLELDRAIKSTPELAERLSPRARDDNTYDKFFRNGVALKIGWPASTQLRGKTVRYVFLMDYDGAQTVDVDGKGSLWGQAFKRIQTYMSRGTCIAESSPGIEYDDAQWRPRTPHEAPPARGIAALYNSGTRARWYWRCRHCGEHFESVPGIEAFNVPGIDELREAVLKHDLMMLAESFARVPCRRCGGLHEPGDRGALNAIRNEDGRVLGATWLHEGQTLEDCRIEGEPRATNVASYWLGGAAAAYQDWVSLMHRYLAAVLNYVRTGDETDLRTSSHDDQAWPYLPLAARRRRSSEDYQERLETWPRGTVPAGVKFLTAAIDVQARKFVVTVMGWGVDLESWVIERFKITGSRRPEGDDLFAAVDPAAYAEDWLLLVDKVIERGYPLEEEPNLELLPVVCFCDSGGKEGVTDKAYGFWRVMKSRGLGQRFRLVKGDGNLNAPRIKQTWPDARARKDRKAGRGDVPVYLLNVNAIKDGVYGDLAREKPGPGYVHLPDWLDDGYFDEMAAETRTPKGWQKQRHTANEAPDLHTYNRAACIALQAEAIDWQHPPVWASGIDANPFVFSTGARDGQTSSSRPRRRRIRSQGI